MGGALKAFALPFFSWVMLNAVKHRGALLVRVHGMGPAHWTCRTCRDGAEILPPSGVRMTYGRDNILSLVATRHDLRPLRVATRGRTLQRPQPTTGSFLREGTGQMEGKTPI